MITEKKAVKTTDLPDLQEYLDLSTAATGALFGVPDKVVLDCRKNPPNGGTELIHPTLAIHMRVIKEFSPDYSEASFTAVLKALKRHGISVTPTEFAPLFGLERTAYNRWQNGEKGTQKTTALWRTFIDCLDRAPNPKKWFRRYREIVLLEGALRGVGNVLETGMWGGESEY